MSQIELISLATYNIQCVNSNNFLSIRYIRGKRVFLETDMLKGTINFTTALFRIYLKVTAFQHLNCAIISKKYIISIGSNKIYEGWFLSNSVL